jgi:hypothetical protein
LDEAILNPWILQSALRQPSDEQKELISVLGFALMPGEVHGRLAAFLPGDCGSEGQCALTGTELDKHLDLQPPHFLAIVVLLAFKLAQI